MDKSLPRCILATGRIAHRREKRPFDGEKQILKTELVTMALEKVGNPNILVNIVSRRVRQLTVGGHRPLVAEVAGYGTADIALMEIIEGKMNWEMVNSPDLPVVAPTPVKRVRKAAASALAPVAHAA
jgi:DNA-directed RNA polymerase subunit omega